MYRAVTWFMLNQGISPENPEKVLQHAQNMVIELKPHENGQMVWLNGEDVTPYIRSHQVSAVVSQYARIEGLRIKLVRLQHKWRKTRALSWMDVTSAQPFCRMLK